MILCQKNTICTLIDRGRLNPLISEKVRRQADLEFIELCQTSANIGDVLFHIAFDNQLPIGIRLTSALALEPLISASGWAVGNKFQDKELLTSLLLKPFLNTSNSCFLSDPSNLVSAILRVISKIIALEFPSSKWEELLSSVIDDSNVLLTGGFRLDLITQVTSQCKSNTFLWFFLAEKFEKKWFQFLLQRSTTFRSTCFEVFWNLLKARPKKQAEINSLSLYSPSQLLLLEPSLLMKCVREVLEQQLQDIQMWMADEAERSRCLKVLNLLLLIAQDLTKTEDQALFLLNILSSLLIYFYPVYLSALSCPIEELSCLLQTILSGVQYILTAFTQQPFERAEETIQAVLMYLIRFPTNYLGFGEIGTLENDEEYNEEEMSRLKHHVMEEEVIPLGCGGDDVPSLAGCVLELFLESNTSQCVPILSSLFSLFAYVEQHGKSTHAVCSFFSNAVFHIGRVGVMTNCCLAYNALDQLDTFFSQFYSAAWGYCSSHPLICSTLVYGVSQLFFYYPETDGSDSINGTCSSFFRDGATEETGLNGRLNYFLNFLEQVHHTASELHRGSPSHGFLASMAMYSIAAILQHLRCMSLSLRRQLVHESWWSGSFENASKASSHFHLFAYCELMNAIMNLHPEVKNSLSQFDECFFSVIENFCVYSTIRAMPLLLTRFLHHLMEHQPGVSCCTVQKGLALLGERCSCFHTHSAALILRQLSFLIVDFATRFASHHSNSNSSTCFCEWCVFHCVSGLVPLLCQFGSTMGPLDESTTRSLSTCFSMSMLSFENVLSSHAELVLHSTMHVLAGCTQERHSSSTISGVCSSIAIQLLSAVRRRQVEVKLLDYANITLQNVLGTPLDEVDLIQGRNGMHDMGTLVVFSLALIHHPSACLQFIVDGFSTFLSAPGLEKQGPPNLEQQERCKRAWQRALSWSCSLAVFADNMTWSYILSGWLSLLSSIFSLEIEQQETKLFSPLAYSTVYAFPSVFSQKVPQNVWPHQSIGGAIIMGLLLVKRATSKATRLSGFRKELHHLFLVEDMFSFISSAESTTFESLGLPSFLRDQASQSHSGEAVLQKLSELGLQSQIHLQECELVSSP